MLKRGKQNVRESEFERLAMAGDPATSTYCLILELAAFVTLS